MLKSVMIFFCVSFLTIPINANAREKLAIDKSTMTPGTKLIYQTDDGKKYPSTIIDSRNMLGSVGKRISTNADGNFLNNSSTTFSPHSGYRPPGAGGFFKVGMSWEHDFKANGVSRHRKCKVVKSGTYKNRYIIVKNAFLVKCTNQRKDRQRPKFEDIWFLPGFLFEISYKAKWSGGGFTYELIGVQ